MDKGKKFAVTLAFVNFRVYFWLRFNSLLSTSPQQESNFRKNRESYPISPD